MLKADYSRLQYSTFVHILSIPYRPITMAKRNTYRSSLWWSILWKTSDKPLLTIAWLFLLEGYAALRVVCVLYVLWLLRVDAGSLVVDFVCLTSISTCLLTSKTKLSCFERTFIFYLVVHEIVAKFVIRVFVAGHPLSSFKIICIWRLYNIKYNNIT